MDQYQDVMDRLNGTKPVTDRDPFIGAGRSKLIVLSVEPFNDKKLVDGVWIGHGPSVKAVFEVEESPVHPVGSRVVKIWNLFKPAKFSSMATDADQFAQFVCILQGIPEGQHSAGCRAMLKTRAEGGLLEAQPARGSRIIAMGTESGKPNAKTGKLYVKVAWQHVPQDGSVLALTRTALDQRNPYIPSTQQLAPVQQAPQQYVQPMQAAPVQQAPQQYVQPMQAAPVQQTPQAPQAPQAVQGAPAGGFLSLIK
jgi:hypothetical protein